MVKWTKSKDTAEKPEEGRARTPIRAAEAKNAKKPKAKKEAE